jgi:methionine--tRNA ligase beta chain
MTSDLKTIKQKKMKEQITLEQFFGLMDQIEIKNGTIKMVEKIEGSDKMLKMIVDFDEEYLRTVMTNIGNRIDDPQSLVGQTLPFVTNLKPKKLMGVESQAMIMIAEDEEGNLQFPASGIKEGSIFFK